MWPGLGLLVEGDLVVLDDVSAGRVSSNRRVDLDVRLSGSSSRAVVVVVEQQSSSTTTSTSMVLCVTGDTCNTSQQEQLIAIVAGSLGSGLYLRLLRVHTWRGRGAVGPGAIVRVPKPTHLDAGDAEALVALLNRVLHLGKIDRNRVACESCSA